MADCRKCKHNYKMPGDEPRCNRMCDGESDFESITNADKIRSMSDEELAEFLEKFEVCSNCEYMDKKRCTLDNPCVHSIAVAMALKWLQSEAE